MSCKKELGFRYCQNDNIRLGAQQIGQPIYKELLCHVLRFQTTQLSRQFTRLRIISIAFKMKHTFSTLLAASFCRSLASAIPLTSSTSNDFTTRQTTSCDNTATSRSCWGDYSIDTDWYTLTPDTGVIREVRETSRIYFRPNEQQRSGFRSRTQPLRQMDMSAIS